MSATPTYNHGKFVWFEHMSPDVARAQAFYEALFGWRTQGVPMGEQTYPLIENQGKGIGGYRKAGPKAPTHWICFVSVADVDATFNAIKADGLRTLQEPAEYGPGRIAAAADPTGAPFAMWHGKEGDPPDGPTPVGGWHWTELWTSDEAKSLQFYQSMFGYGTDTMSTPNGAYHLLTRDGVPRAGLMKAEGHHGKSMWLPYVAVADCDATLAKALSMGATQLFAPVDMAGVGRFCAIIDPLDAPVGIITVAPSVE